MNWLFRILNVDYQPIAFWERMEECLVYCIAPETGDADV